MTVTAPSATVSADAGTSKLVPIVLGGPWQYDGSFWEVWRNGAIDRCSFYEYRVHEGYLQNRDAWGMWGVSAADGMLHEIEIRAPKGWQPTPETIPEGCYIRTPEGVKRDCGTCGSAPGRTVPECKAAGCGFYHEHNEYAKWCPKPSPATEKPAEKEDEKHKYEVGDRVWNNFPRDRCYQHLGEVTESSFPLQVKCSCGFLSSCPEQYCTKGKLRPICIGDKIRVVDKPKTLGLPANINGTITELCFGDDPPTVIITDSKSSDCWYALLEDIRLVEAAG